MKNLTKISIITVIETLLFGTVIFTAYCGFIYTAIAMYIFGGLLTNEATNKVLQNTKFRCYCLCIKNNQFGPNWFQWVITALFGLLTGVITLLSLIVVILMPSVWRYFEEEFEE